MPVRVLYWLTAGFGVSGCLFFGLEQGWKSAAGFAMGAMGSLVNLWLWEWLSRSIGPSGTTRRSTWQAGLFIGRYLILIAGGYAIVKALGVPPFTVVSGLLTSTAAVLVSLMGEIIQGFLGKRFTG